MIDWASVGVTEISSAVNGLDALEILKQKNIDVIISDIRMPGLNGLELAEYVITHSPKARIIFLTGFSDFSYAQSAINYGVTDYLLKPVAPDQLMETVKKAIHSIELELYTQKIVEAYEQTNAEQNCGAMNAAQQITQSFRNMSEPMMSMLTYLAENYKQNISLHTLAEQSHFSPMHVSRLFKKETGYSFLEVLNAIRLLHATRLLRCEPDKINLICEKIGINDQRYFSQVFKKVFACTPLEYRKLTNELKTYSLLEMLELISENKSKTME